jgi:hypothetical protein
MALSPKRILNAFTSAATTQVKALEMVEQESARHSMDCALLAMRSLRDKVASNEGRVIRNEDIAEAVREVFGNEVNPQLIGTLTEQAKTRHRNRQRHGDPFDIVRKTLKTLRGKANGREEARNGEAFKY